MLVWGLFLDLPPQRTDAHTLSLIPFSFARCLSAHCETAGQGCLSSYHGVMELHGYLLLTSYLVLLNDILPLEECNSCVIASPSTSSIVSPAPRWFLTCATKPTGSNRLRLYFVRREMPLHQPRLRVSQAQSAFAAGNARWTNRDLDPIPLHARKWGVSSLIGIHARHLDYAMSYSNNCL